MPKYFVVHKHEYGGSGYQVETDFDLVQATQDHADWALKLAAAMGIDFEPWKDEEIDICPFDEIEYTDVSEKDFLGAEVSKEIVSENDEEDQ